MKLSFEDEGSLKEAVGSLRFNNPPSDPDSLGVESNSSMSLQDQDKEKEMNEDICLNNPPGDSNTLRRMGSSISMPHQDSERSEDIEMVQRSHSTSVCQWVGQHGSSALV